MTAPLTEPRMDTFTRQYFETALWSSTDESDDQGGEPLDKNYSIDDIAPETRTEMISDCADFQEKYSELLVESGMDFGRAGHNFWLSRNGHGAGFFDDDQDELQEAAKSYGEFNLYVGDDGQIHGTPLSGHRTSERRRKKTRLATHRVTDFKKGDRIMWSDSFLERGRRIDPKWYALRKNERGTVDWIQRDGDVLVQWDNEHDTTVHPPDRLAHATDRVLEEHTVADFNTMDDLLAHARDELGATHVAFIDDETHLYFKRADGAYEKAEVWQKDSYWHAQGPGSRAVVRKLPADARPIGGGRQRAAEVRERNWSSVPYEELMSIAHAHKWSPERDAAQAELVRRKGRTREPHLARDYIAVDSRGRTIAGPFKSYGDAKQAAGLGGNVEYVRETGTAGVFEVDEWTRNVTAPMTNREAIRVLKNLARSTYSAEGRNSLDIEALKAIRIHAREDETVAAAVETLGERNAAEHYYAELEQCALTNEARPRPKAKRSAARRR